MTTKWKVHVDRSVCIGSGMCAGTAPDRFTLGPEHKSHPLADLIDPDERVIDAACNCPVEAITVTDEATGETLAPEE
jgi:ferredoxin